MNLDKLSMGEKILGACAALLFLLSFAGIWAKIEIEGAGIDASQSFNARTSYGFLMDIAILLALVATILVIAKVAGANLTLPFDTIYMAIGIVTFLILLLTLILGPDETGSGDFGVGSVEISRGIGLFVGTVLAAGMAYGAWMHKQAPGETATTTAPVTPA